MTKIADNDSDPVNDSGTGRDGTRINEAWYDALIAVIDDLIHSTTNTTVTPADIIDEVVDARGSQSTLDDRWDEEHEEDGTHKAVVTSTVVSTADFLGGIGAVNLPGNDDFLIWPEGDSAAPAFYTLAGTGAVVARAGTGLGDSTRKIGDLCAKLTRGTTDLTLTQTLLSGTAYTRADFIEGLYACGGAWVKSSTANAARVAVYDGAGYTYSSYHTGGGSWEWLPVSRQVNVSGNQLQIICQVNNTAITAYFSGTCLMLLDSDQTLTRYSPAPTAIRGDMHLAITGTISTGTTLGLFEPSRPGIVQDVQLHVLTAPTDAALIIDINTWDSAAYTSMFSTNPEIIDTGFRGGAQPDGTYARRCFVGQHGSSLVEGGAISLDIDQVGSTIAGEDLGVEVRSLQYERPLERFLDYNG